MKFNGEVDKILKIMWIVIVWNIWNQRIRVNEFANVEEVFSMTQLKTWARLGYRFPKPKFHIMNGFSVKIFVLNSCCSNMGNKVEIFFNRKCCRFIFKWIGGVEIGFFNWYGVRVFGNNSCYVEKIMY